MNKPIQEMNKADLDLLNELSYAQYSEWYEAQPDSPIPESLRLPVRGAYDLQKYRIALGNRIFAHFRTRLGIPPGEKEDSEKADANAKKVLDELRVAFERITEGVPGGLASRRKFVSGGVFNTYTEYVMVGAFLNVFKQEVLMFKNLTEELVKIPVYNDFLEKVPGCGNAISGFLLTELNPYRARFASSFWAYLGVDVHRDGTGRSGKKIHNEATWTREADGNGGYRMKKVEKKTHNPEAKAKMMGVLAETLLRAGLRWEIATQEQFDATPEPFRKIDKGWVVVDEETWQEENRKRQAKVKGALPCKTMAGGTRKIEYPDLMQTAIMTGPYVERYLDYKHRKANSIAPAKVYRKDGGNLVLKEIPWCETSPAHRDMAAKRAMIKTFLVDFWEAWRKAEGLPVGLSYAEQFLGHEPHHAPRRKAS